MPSITGGMGVPMPDVDHEALFDARLAAVRAAHPELAALTAMLSDMLGGDPYQEGRWALGMLEHLETPQPVDQVSRPSAEDGMAAAGEDQVAVAMRMVADAQRDLVQMVTQGARAVAERQQALAIALGARPRQTPPSPDADTLIVDIDWDTRAVTFTQTTGNVLRCAVNGAWAEVPDRARISLSFNDVARPVAVPVSDAHLILPDPTRSGPRAPQPGEVLVRLLRPARGETFMLGPHVALVDSWSEDDPSMLMLRVRGPVDAVRALFPGASEFAGPDAVRPS